MIIANLEHLEILTASTHELKGTGKQIISLSLNQGVLLLSLNGKELFKTTLADLSSDLGLSANAFNLRTLYRGKISGAGSSAWVFRSSRLNQSSCAFASSSINFLSKVI